MSAAAGNGRNILTRSAPALTPRPLRRLTWRTAAVLPPSPAHPTIAELAEESGLDGVWLAERHFAAPRRPTDPMGAGIPSIASVPLVLAAAIAAVAFWSLLYSRLGLRIIALTPFVLLANTSAFAGSARVTLRGAVTAEHVAALMTAARAC